MWGLGDALGVWDGNTIQLDCDDHCTTINVINSLSNKKRKRKKNTMNFFAEQILTHRLEKPYSCQRRQFGVGGMCWGCRMEIL